MGPRVVVIDNYDSFVYNLVQYLRELGALLISPGPGRPSDAGISSEAIRRLGGAGLATLGVCLGHQCIGEVYGGSVVSAPELMHGKTSLVHHDEAGVLAGLVDPFEAT